MRLPGRRAEVVPAPVWRRVVAALIDLWPLALAPVAFAAAVLSVGATLKVRQWWIGEERDASWDEDEDEDEDDDEDQDEVDDDGDDDENAAVGDEIARRPVDLTSSMTDSQRRWTAFLSSWQWRVAMMASSALVAVRFRNRRTRGARAMGIRRADARTGGPVSVRSALIAFAIRAAWRELARRVVRGPQLDATAWTAIRARRTNDPNARSKEDGNRVQRSRVRAAVQQWAITVAPSLSVLWTARRQSIPDWLAGIVVVWDDS